MLRHNMNFIMMSLIVILLVTPATSQNWHRRSQFPVITEHPISVTVSRNSPVTLNCGVSGSPPPTVSWLKDGSPVKTGAGDHLMILPDGSLFFLRTVQNKKNQDSGEYRCQAENQHGAVLSNPATLTVTFLREKFGVVPTNIEALEGNDVKLVCLAPEGHPKPSIKWFKNGEVVTRMIDSSGSLMLRGSMVTDSGQYSCLATNAVGVRQDRPIFVVVKPRKPPTIISAKLIDSTTGIVQWLPQEEATGYLVLIAVETQMIKNITIEKGITQVKLHSLAENQIYSAQVSAIYGTVSSNFSKIHTLESFTKEVILPSPPEEVPMSVLVLAMTVVGLVTILIIVAAAIICHRTLRIRRELKKQNQSHFTVNGKKCWMERTWNFNSGSKIDSLGSSRGLIQDAHPGLIQDTHPGLIQDTHPGLIQDTHPGLIQDAHPGLIQDTHPGLIQGTHYSYAVPADHNNSYSVTDSTHYASSSVLKQNYYLPLSLAKVGDFHSQNSYRKYSQPISLS